MARERHRRLLLLRAPPHLLPVAAVLRREHEVTEVRVVVAIRPAEVIALVHPQQLLRRLFGALLGGEKLGPVLEELVPAVLRGPQLAVWRDHHPHGVANPGGVMRPALFGLVLLSRIEAPDPRSRGELGARVLPRRFVRPIGDLTHIRRRADVDEQGLAVGGERQIPRAVPASGKVPHDHARLAHRLEPAGGSANRYTVVAVLKYSAPLLNTMPVPPAVPAVSRSSAFPSPLVSRKARTPPFAPAPRPSTSATKMSPLGATARWRARPTWSATTTAQNPAGSVMPPLSGSQAGEPSDGRTVGLTDRASAAQPAAVIAFGVIPFSPLWCLRASLGSPRGTTAHPSPRTAGR